MRLSTSQRTHLAFAFHPPIFAIISMVVMLWCIPVVNAAECVEEEAGICIDDTTFEWCEDGELKTAKCPEGQICVTDNPWYEGAGCVATDDTACGDVPPQGECTTANSVVWCDEGVPRVHPCDDDSECGWDEESGWYDCLPTGNTTPTSDSGSSFAPDFQTADADEHPDSGDESGNSDSEDLGPEPDSSRQDDQSTESTSDDTSGALTRDDVPTPTVTSGPADPSTSGGPGSGAGGCAGGSTPSLWSLIALCALALNRRRRAYNVATA